MKVEDIRLEDSMMAAAHTSLMQAIRVSDSDCAELEAAHEELAEAQQEVRAAQEVVQAAEVKVRERQAVIANLHVQL